MQLSNKRPSPQTMAARKTNDFTAHNIQNQNRLLPRYLYKIKGKKLDPIFFTSDPGIINYFDKIGAICLFCNKFPKWYSLGFCSGIECCSHLVLVIWHYQCLEYDRQHGRHRSWTRSYRIDLFYRRDNSCKSTCSCILVGCSLRDNCRTLFLEQAGR